MPGWKGELRLRYRSEGWGETEGSRRTVVHDRHSGPLRVLASLYPESREICHNVVVHPPGGIVGGDSLSIDAELESGAHALLTTPGATRFYRSAGATARQQVVARVAEGARLEWLPLETIVHRGALAQNHLRFELAPGASMLGWDVLALGLPASDEPFECGTSPSRFEQQIELPTVWLERGIIRLEGVPAIDGHPLSASGSGVDSSATSLAPGLWRVGQTGHRDQVEPPLASALTPGDALDRRLLDSPLGWAGKRVLCTMWSAGGSPLGAPLVERLLDEARDLVANDPLAAMAGATSPDGRVVVLRILADKVEPCMQLAQRVWVAWRMAMWSLPACPPRIWRM
ncbi:MAG: urease accessory protein [Rhizobacter sp.]|nr:urease accessory protein [Rhizobacter sp.]